MVHILVPNTSAAVQFDATRGKWVLGPFPTVQVDALPVPELGVLVQGSLDIEEPTLSTVGSMLTTLSEAWDSLCCATYAKRQDKGELPGMVTNATGAVELPAGLTLDAPSKLVRKVFGHTLAVDTDAAMCDDLAVRTAVSSCLSLYAPLGALYQQYTCLKALGLTADSQPPAEPEPPVEEEIASTPLPPEEEEVSAAPMPPEEEPASIPPEEEALPSMPPEEPAPTIPEEIITEHIPSPFPPPPSGEVPIFHIGTFSYDPASNLWAPGQENVVDGRIMVEGSEKQKFRMKSIAAVVASLEYLAALLGPTLIPYKLPSPYSQTSRLSMCMEKGKTIYEFTHRGWEETVFGIACSNVLPSFTLGCRLSYDNDVVQLNGEDWEFLIGSTLNNFNTASAEVPHEEPRAESVVEISNATVCFGLLSQGVHMKYDFRAGWWATVSDLMPMTCDAQFDLGPKDFAFGVDNWEPTTMRVLATILASMEDAYRSYCAQVFRKRDDICAGTVYGNYDVLMSCVPASAFSKWPHVSMRHGTPDISISFYSEGEGTYTHLSSGWAKNTVDPYMEELPVKFCNMSVRYNEGTAPADSALITHIIMETFQAFQPVDTEETRFVYALTHFI